MYFMPQIFLHFWNNFKNFKPEQQNYPGKGGVLVSVWLCGAGGLDVSATALTKRIADNDLVRKQSAQFWSCSAIGLLNTAAAPQPAAPASRDKAALIRCYFCMIVLETPTQAGTSLFGPVSCWVPGAECGFPLHLLSPHSALEIQSEW